MKREHVCDWMRKEGAQGDCGEEEEEEEMIGHIRAVDVRTRLADEIRVPGL